MTEERLMGLLVIYCCIAVACVIALIFRWTVKTKGDLVIWPITGVLWPILALIGLWKVWKEARHD